MAERSGMGRDMNAMKATVGYGKRNDAPALFSYLPA
jgi:hypothetical protein